MNTLQFVKMQGLGNDFMVIDGVRQVFNLSRQQIQELADRHYGVGFDQLLVAAPSPTPEADFAYLIFNQDGSPAEQCGNGARCIAKFIHKYNLDHKKTFKLWTQGKITLVHLEDDGNVTVQLSEPYFDPLLIPFQTTEKQAPFQLAIAGRPWEFYLIGIGNPHAVIVVDTIETKTVETIGAEISKHPSFPQGVNVGFMQINSSEHIFLRVYERGAGLTLACGSGACAAAAIGRKVGLLGPRVQVSQPGGDLWINWQGPTFPVYMRGPAQFVYEGIIHKNTP